MTVHGRNYSFVAAHVLDDMQSTTAATEQHAAASLLASPWARPNSVLPAARRVFGSGSMIADCASALAVDDSEEEEKKEDEGEHAGEWNARGSSTELWGNDRSNSNLAATQAVVPPPLRARKAAATADRGSTFFAPTGGDAVLKKNSSSVSVTQFGFSQINSGALRSLLPPPSTASPSMIPPSCREAATIVAYRGERSGGKKKEIEGSACKSACTYIYMKKLMSCALMAMRNEQT